MASGGVKRKILTYQQKYDIIKYAEANPVIKQVTIAAKFGLKPQTLSDILHKKEEIIHFIEDPNKVAWQTGTKKHVKKVTYNDVDSALLLWFQQKAILPDLQIDSEMLWQKAEFFARQFGNEDPKITMACIECFKKRWGIAKINKSGEAGDVDIEVVNK